MAKVIAWKCESTGTFFETEDEFRAHLCRKGFNRFVLNRKKARRATLDARIGVLRQMTSFAEIEDWLNTNGDVLFEHAYEKFSQHDKKRADKNRKKHPHSISDVRIEKMRWASIPTTHNAPMGRKTTGYGDTPAESHFGWRGRISYIQKNFPTFASDIFKNTAINTGSGGGGFRLEYELYLFAEDFPFMLEMMRQEGRLDPGAPYPFAVTDPLLP